MEGGYSLDTEAHATSTAKGGSAKSGTGDWIINSAPAGAATIPAWAIVVLAIAGLFLLFRWKGKK